MRIASRALGVSGQCDVVEFRANPAGISLRGWDGLWVPHPVEYKRGEPKPNDADELQLCGQAMCLEEMLACEIREGDLFYGETRRRQRVEFTPELRKRVSAFLTEMHELAARGYTPRCKPTKGCNACSLKELCLPRLSRVKSVENYLREQEAAECGNY